VIGWPDQGETGGTTWGFLENLVGAFCFPFVDLLAENLKKK
jgi:hypothetical protein